jgi:hypothetical protein
MNSVAGASGRFELLSRRWSIIGLTTAITVFLAGQILDMIVFPLNYQIILIIFSLGGVLSYQYSRRINIPSHHSPPISVEKTIVKRLHEFIRIIVNKPPFLNFASKRLIFSIGLTMVAPLLPLYYVREIGAPDSWIAIFSTTQTILNFVGYFIWLKQSRTKGSQYILIITTLAMSFYPTFVAISSQFWMITVFAAIQGLFEAGLNLVFFDELMKTVPEERSATFVSVAQSLQFLASFIAPWLATLLADKIGLSYALFCASGVQLIGFLLFFITRSRSSEKIKIREKNERGEEINITE